MKEIKSLESKKAHVLERQNTKMDVKIRQMRSTYQILMSSDNYKSCLNKIYLLI